MRSLKLALVATALTVSAAVSCNIQPPDGSDDKEADKNSQTNTGENTDTSTEPVACTDDARMVCVETAPGEYAAQGVGREGLHCEFKKLPNEVDAKLCPETSGDDAQCKESEDAIQAELDVVRACEADADCGPSDVGVGCPFGCYGVRNKNADTAKVEGMLKDYHQMACQPCDYECQQVEDPPVYQCVNKHCQLKPAGAP